MKIKRNDKVKILAGKDKGKIGKVLQVFPDGNKASVEGINLLIKHLRPQKQGEKGQRIEFPAPMNISNLMIICPKCNKETRVEYTIVKNEDDTSADSVRVKNKKFRKCKKCQEVID
ncbi:50S ribosomal protein L24 [Candidatus Parcubacteria bacterium]|nr:50S ribosomal protein L24 [Candidatus Parcubacteria bacterium]